MTKKLSKQLKMTNKFLSQNICEECGIKPTIIEDYDSNEYEIYPDFENNNNFIKLEEIMLAELAKHHLTVVKWVHYWSDNTLMHEYILITKTGHKIKFKHNDIQVDNWFVEHVNRADCLILFILWKVLPICGESIKQAIRQATWEV